MLTEVVNTGWTTYTLNYRVCNYLFTGKTEQQEQE